MIHRFALAAVMACVLAPPAHAGENPLVADGTWQLFSIDDLLANSQSTNWYDDSNGTALSFAFTIGAGTVGTLTVVDGGFAGDTFSVTNFGALLGTTSSVAPGSYEAAIDTGYDFNAALANPSFSRGVFTLGEGSYNITGSLLQSVTLGGQALNSTIGAVQLTVAAVPEPSSFALLSAGLGLIGLLARHRHRNGDR